MSRGTRAQPRTGAGGGYLLSVSLLRDRVPSFRRYPFSIPAVRSLRTLAIDPAVTIVIGDNSTGKSTLIEAIAVAAGFNPEGGSKHFRFATRASESDLHRFLKVVRGARRERDGFFVRAESLFNVATEIEALEVGAAYGDRSLHEQSHGESFLAVALHRFRGQGLYILDEPEAALSPTRQLAFLRIMHDLVTRRAAQLVVATHSPILMAYPGARLYLLSERGITTVAYRDTEHYRVLGGFLADPEQYLRRVLDDGSRA